MSDPITDLRLVITLMERELHYTSGQMLSLTVRDVERWIIDLKLVAITLTQAKADGK